MQRLAILALGLISLSLGVPTAQTEVVTGDYSSSLRPLAGDNVGISNAVLRDQPEVRILRVVVEAGGTRVIHAHDNVDFHLFVPISGPMTFDREGAESVEVPPWQPVYMDAGTRHGFRNTGSSAVDIMEIFIQ
jgi:mannose-6-phosphate isomerase-like protein (cupin superfamily)